MNVLLKNVDVLKHVVHTLAHNIQDKVIRLSWL